MRAFRPKGLRIFVDRSRGPLRTVYSYSAKSKGRTGAAVRSRFMRLDGEKQQYVLAEWAQRRAASL